MASRIAENRRKEIMLARLRIGHSYTSITHSYLLKGDEEPQCIPCYAPLTIKHVDCVDLAPIEQRFFDVDSLTTLFDTVKFESVFDFLKEIHLYRKK